MVQKLFNKSLNIHTKYQNWKSNENFVILAAANNKYFPALVRLIKNVKEYFKDKKIIIYDLGIHEQNLVKVILLYNFRNSV